MPFVDYVSILVLCQHLFHSAVRKMKWNLSVISMVWENDNCTTNTNKILFCRIWCGKLLSFVLTNMFVLVLLSVFVIFFFFWAVLMVQYVDSIVRTNDAMNDTIENHGRIFWCVQCSIFNVPWDGSAAWLADVGCKKLRISELKIISWLTSCQTNFIFDNSFFRWCTPTNYDWANHCISVHGSWLQMQLWTIIMPF